MTWGLCVWGRRAEEKEEEEEEEEMGAVGHGRRK